MEIMKQEIEDALASFRKAAELHELYPKMLVNREKMAFWDATSEEPETLLIGEAPANDEARVGKPFVGKSGRLLRRALEQAGIKDYAITNVMPMKPVDTWGKIRKPTEQEIQTFRPYLMGVIAEVKPKRIILLGKNTTKAMNAVWKPLTWKGKTGIIYHPAYYLRGNRNIFNDFATLLNKEPNI